VTPYYDDGAVAIYLGDAKVEIEATAVVATSA
jgi:hypothetical protein